MSRRSGIALAVFLLAAVALPTLALTFAEPPSDKKHLELPDLPELKFTPGKSKSPVTQDRIRKALEGEGPVETGDPVLDDVLQSIKRRGSIFEGSALEAAQSELGPEKAAKSTTEKARAAEALLKAARMLERVQPADKTRRELVSSMRRESVRLLTQ